MDLLSKYKEILSGGAKKLSSYFDASSSGGNNFWGAKPVQGAVNILQKQYNPQSYVQPVKSFAKGVGNMSTMGLVSKFDQQNPDKFYRAGQFAGLINPLNPVNKVMGALNVGGRAVGWAAPKLGIQAAGKLGTKIIPGLLSEAAQTGAYTAAQQGAGALGIGPKVPLTKENILPNLLIGLGTRGAFNKLGKAPNAKGFTLPNNTRTELEQAEDMLSNPKKYIGQIKAATQKARTLYTEEAKRKVILEARDTIDRLGGAFLPTDVLNKVTGDPKKMIKALIDLNAENKLGYTMGFAGKNQVKPAAQGGMYDTPQTPSLPEAGRKVTTKSIGGLSNGEGTVLSIDDIEFKNLAKLDKTKYKVEPIDQYSVQVTKLSPEVGGVASKIDSLASVGDKAVLKLRDQLFSYTKKDNKWFSGVGGKEVTSPEIVKSLESQLEKPSVILKDLIDSGEMWDSGNLSISQTNALKELEAKGIVSKVKGVAGVNDTANGVADIWKLKPSPQTGEINPLIQEAKKYKSAEEFQKVVADISQKKNKFVLDNGGHMAKFNEDKFVKGLSADEKKFYEAFKTSDYNPVREGVGDYFYRITGTSNPNASKITELEQTMKGLKAVGADISHPDEYKRVFQEWQRTKYPHRFVEGKPLSSPQTPSLPEVGGGVAKEIQSQLESPLKISKETPKITLAKSEVPATAGRTSQPLGKVSTPVKVEGQMPQQPSSPSTPIIAPKEKYAYNVNLNRLNLKPQEKVTLQKTVDIITPELEKLKGKKVSNREVIEAAKTSEMLQKTTTRAATLEAEAAMLKARQQMVSLDKEVDELARKGNTPELRAKITDLVGSLKVISSNNADKGRQLQSLAIGAEDESLRQQMLKDILKNTDDTNKVIEQAMKVNWDNAGEVYKFYRSFIKPSTTQILDEFRYNNMLSNPRTHIRNAFSNLVQTFITRPATLAAQGELKGTKQYYQGVFKSFPEAVDAFKKSFSGESAISKPDLEYAPTMKLPKLLTVPTRAMEAADKFFTALIKGGEVARGATPEQAGKVAEYSLFRQGLYPEGQGAVLNQIDNFTSGMYSFGNKFTPIRWFVPFIRTPMNFAKQWIEYSPAGLATTVGAGNKKEQVAKAMVGSVITALGAKVALDDRTTWSAPTDPKQKEQFYATGRKPFSVKIGDKWVSMQYLGPFGLAVAIPAAMKYYQDESRTALTDSQMDKIGQSLMGVAEFFSGQTFLEGINNFVKLASGDIDYTLPKNVAYTSSQMIPLQGLIRWVSTIVDPVYRKPSGSVQQLQQNIPFLSKSLPAYTMPNGEESKREGLNLITPYDITKSNPQYEQGYQERTQKLQQNAVVNELKKQAEKTNKPQSLGDMTVLPDGKTIDMNFQPTPPNLVGATELDKIARSNFNSDVEKKRKDIYALWEAGKIDQAEAVKQIQNLDALKAQYAAPKAKKITIKKLSVKKVKAYKPKKIKIPKMKKAKVYKLKQIKLSKIKLKRSLG